MPPTTTPNLFRATLFSLLLLAAGASAVEARPQFSAPFLAYPIAGTGTPRSLALGDFNEDGRVDVVVHTGGANFALRFGDGAGGLAPLTAAPPACQVSATVVAADVNEDGHLDLALINGGFVSILPGTGLGTFGPRVDYPAAAMTSRLTLADLDADGHLDLAATYSSDPNGISVWRGQGDGTFVGRTEVLDLWGLPNALLAADVNEDGHLDLLSTDMVGGGMVHIFPGHGDLTFGDVLGRGAGLYPVGLTCGDLDQDGHADYVTANADMNGVTIARGRGDGTFIQTAVAVGGRPYAAAPGDFNGDGRLDLAVVNHAPNYAEAGHTVTILLADGAGSYLRFADLPVGTGPRAIEAVDLDQDGRLDLVIACDSSKYLVTLSGNGDGTFGTPRFGVDTSPLAVALGDLDRDGHADVVTLNEYNATLSVRLGQVPRAFGAPATYAVPVYPGGVALGDLNQDTFTDVLVAASGTLSFFPGDGAGHLGARVDRAVTGGLRSPVLADLDQDGRADLVVADGANSRVLVLLGNGAGGFGPPAALATPSATYAVRVVDLDGDGRPDLAAANNGAGSLSIFRGTGGGSFAPRLDYPSGNAPWDLATDDLDGDGRADIVVANDFGQTLSIFHGNGDATLTRLADVPAGPYPIAVATLDANHDGHPDLAVANAGTSTASIHYGNGDGTFTTHEEYGSGIYPRALAARDMDNDGETDVVVVNYGNSDSYSDYVAGTFTLLWNRGQPPVAVELLAFDAVRTTDGARIRWQVTEDATRHLYTLHRGAADGTRPAVTAPLTGQTRYEVIDADAPAGPVTYWLRDVAPAGGVAWHGPFELADAPPSAPRLALWPNPARGPVTLTFSLAAEATAHVAVFDAAGRQVARLVDQPLGAGTHQLVWDRRNDAGRLLRPGVYFVRFETPTINRSEKLLILN